MLSNHNHNNNIYCQSIVVPRSPPFSILVFLFSTEFDIIRCSIRTHTHIFIIKLKETKNHERKKKKRYFLSLFFLFLGLFLFEKEKNSVCRFSLRSYTYESLFFRSILRNEYTRDRIFLVKRHPNNNNNNNWWNHR